MTSPSSPAISEILSSTADDGLDDCAHSEASSPEMKRAKRQNLRTRLQDILTNRLYSPTNSPTELREKNASNSIQEYKSQISFNNAENDNDVFNECSSSGLRIAENLCCSLSVDACNECKGLDVDCGCCSHSISEPTEISLELRSDRRDRVVSSYYSHFKQTHSTPLLQNEQSKVESDVEDVAKENDLVPNNIGADRTSDMCWRDNVIMSGILNSVAVISDDDEPFVPRDPQAVDAGILTDCSLSHKVVAKDAGNQLDDDFVAMPSVSDLDEDDHVNVIEIISIDKTSSGDENDLTEGIMRLPEQTDTKIIEINDQITSMGQKWGSMNLNTSAGENTSNMEALSPIDRVYENTKVSPSGESFPTSITKTEKIYENSSTENLYSEILENSKLENGLEVSQDSKNDSGQFLGSWRIQKELKSELEFSTVLTLAYVRVRDLTNSIDKAQEYLTKIDKNDDEDDIDQLRYKIQAMFDSRATLSLEQAKWRSQFSNHFQQRKRVLASLKSRACRTEQTYFQLRKELLDLEKEPIIPKRKRSLFSKIFSFRFVK